MKKNRIISAVLIALTLTALVSCSKKAVWLTDYEEAKQTAVKQNKNLMVFFSGNDWDSSSTSLREKITDNSKFTSAVSKDYVLVNIDFSQDIYQKVLSYDEETATEKEKEEYEKVAAEYALKSDIARKYNLSSYPAIFLATPEEYIIAQLEYNADLDTAETMAERVGNLKTSAENIKTLAAKVKDSEGLDRVRAIDALYEATSANNRMTLNSFVREIPVLDSNNETGLLGKYEMQICYLDALDFAAVQDMDGASKTFENAADNGHMSLEERQEAYYTGAYVLTSEPNLDFERIIGLLEKAYDVYPTGSHAEDIKSTILAVKEMQIRTELETAKVEEKLKSENSESAEQE